MRVLLRFLVSCVLGLAWLAPAFAEGSVGTVDSQGTYYTDTFTTTHYPSLSAACDGVIAYLNSQGGVYNANNGGYDTVQINFLSGSTCAYSGVKWGAGDYVVLGSGTGSITGCPSNSTASSGSSCTCASGYVPNGSGCSPASTACQGFAGGMSGTYYAAGGTGGLTLCHANCVMQSGLSGSDGTGTYFSGPYSATGSACSGDTSAPPSGTPPLQPGQCPGSVNGVAVAVPCGSTSSGSSSSTTPGGSSTASAPAGASNGTSTSSQTTCTGGTCSTTTTTTTTTGVGSAGGGTSTTGSSTTTQSQAAFCQANPSDPQCAAQSSFGGSCSAGFSCKGDAVACATAQVEYQSTCLFNASPSSATTATYGALKAQDGQTAQGAFTSSMAVDSVLPAAPPAACAVQDVVIPIGSGMLASSLTLPFGTYLCPSLGAIRAVVVGFGSLIFILIVFVRN